MHDVLKIPHAAGEAVDARHHQGVAGPQEVEQRFEL
jgi:hypothetical protein